MNFIKNLLKSFLKSKVRQLMNQRWFSTLMLKIIPYIRLTTYYTSFEGWKYHRGYKLLKPGDIIVTKDAKKLTSFLIPGEWAHAALCVSKDEVFEVAEMTHEDYRRSCFWDLTRESTSICIYRCKDWDEEYTKKVIEKCKSFSDCKYDIEFKLGIKALYCSELVYQSDFEKRLKVSLDDVALIGVKYISPDGLANAKNVELVWDSDKESL